MEAVQVPGTLDKPLPIVRSECRARGQTWHQCWLYNATRAAKLLLLSPTLLLLKLQAQHLQELKFLCGMAITLCCIVTYHALVACIGKTVTPMQTMAVEGQSHCVVCRRSIA